MIIMLWEYEYDDFKESTHMNKQFLIPISWDNGETKWKKICLFYYSTLPALCFFISDANFIFIRKGNFHVSCE